MNVVHKHLIIRAETENTPSDQKWAHTWLTELVKKIGMEICQGPITTYVNVPGNRGLTGLVIIETSHIALHCWDENNPGMLQLDIYSCGDFDTAIIFEELKQFNPVKMEYKYLDREKGLKEIAIIGD